MKLIDELFKQQSEQQKVTESLLQKQVDDGISARNTEMLRHATKALNNTNTQIQRFKDTEVLERMKSQFEDHFSSVKATRAVKRK